MNTLKSCVCTFLPALLCWLPQIDAYGHSPDVVLSGSGTAKIDGVITAGEWAGAATAEFAVKLPDGGTTPGKLYVMNDAVNLYLGVSFAGAYPGNTADFEFDNDHSGGQVAEGDDAILLNPDVGFVDAYRTSLPPCPGNSVCGFFDTDSGGTTDGAGAFRNDGGQTVYEMSHPLNSGDAAHDFSLSTSNTVGFVLLLRIIDKNNIIADTGFPEDCVCPDLYGDIVITRQPVQEVSLKIKDGETNVPVNVRSQGVIPVSILTTTTFDAWTADPKTIRFGATGTEAAAIKYDFKDVNGDGVVDLVLQFRTQETGLHCGTTSATLKGKTFNQQAIQGQGSIVTVGCK